MLTEKQKYFHLLAEVCEILPRYCVDNAIRAGWGQAYPSAATRLHHVKQGKVPSLPDLVALIEHSMPDYTIPEPYRPREDAAPAPVPAAGPLFAR